MKKKSVWGLTALASAWCIAADFPSYLEGDWGVTASVVAGVAFAIAGGIAATRRPENRTGALLLLCAFAWPFGSLPKYGDPLLAEVGIAGAWLWVIALTYLVLAFPNGRLERRKEAVVCWVASLPAFWLVLVTLPFLHFSDPFSKKALIPRASESIIEALDLTGTVLAMVTVGMLISCVRDKWQRATVAGQRVLAPVVLTGAVALAATAVIVTAQLYLPAVEPYAQTLRRLNWLLVAGVPVGFVIGLSRARARRARVGELVVELGELPSPERLQDALRKALGDPTLVAAFWVPDAQRYLTAEGRALLLPDDNSSSVATYIERGGDPLGVIVHDRYLMEDPALVASATAAARLAVENERLQQEVIEQLTEVRASRSRIVQAGDEARRRLERDLHDGAQQRLVTLGLKLQSLEAKVDLDGAAAVAFQEARGELKSALAELRDLARGLHPLVLTEEGVAAAVETLVQRFPVSARMHTEEIPRLPEPVETAAYFTVSEALANIAKHSHATSVDIRLAVENERLIVSVSDNGIGGASLNSGSGLRGLADRVEALDGSISVTSQIGRGTTVRADLPLVPPNTETAAFLGFDEQEPALAERRQIGKDDASALLLVRDLDVYYGPQQVLFGIDLHVRPGERVAILGTNGAGKSTLARTIAGLHDHLRGSVALAGRELTDVVAEQRTRAGLVFVEGGAGVFGPLSVDENLRLFARHADLASADGLELAFDAFPILARRRAQKAGSLSRGEQHMLALTRAVMSRAALVIVDELSLGLAADAVEDVYAQLGHLNERGTAVLFVEQSSVAVSGFAERVYFLDAGRVLFEGPMSDLVANDLIAPAWLHARDPAHA